MKRWAVLVVLLYLAILIALTAPFLLVAFYPQESVHSALGIFSDRMYWAVLAVMVVGQAVMLVTPVDLTLHRPTTRRSVLWPTLASGLMVGLLVVGAVISVNEYIRKDKATNSITILLPVVLVVWAVWTLVFYRTSRDAAPMDVITRQCRYLVRGSILELLVAVPTHIVARARDYCCAGFWTFLGIAFGVAVMLFSFGPGVFFLFAARWKRLQPQPGRTED
jgi:hypothetical protein